MLYLGAEFRYTRAGGLSHSVVVSLTLTDIELNLADGYTNSYHGYRKHRNQYVLTNQSIFLCMLSISMISGQT